MGFGLEVIRYLTTQHTQEHSYRGYHHSTAWDFAARGHGIPTPQDLKPKDSPYVSQFAGLGLVGAMIFSRHSKHEKWYVAGLLLSLLHFFAWKCHTVGNGMEGHSTAAWANGLGMSAMCVRIYLGTGSGRVNACGLIGLGLCMWYDLGRHHMWSSYYARLWMDKLEQRRLASPWTGFMKDPGAATFVNYAPVATK